MNALLPAGVRSQAAGAAWRAPWVSAAVGYGMRTGTALGSGVEFSQYRAFETGDDLRHVDKHVYGRLGRTVVRQYTQEQAVRVSVLLDASASMGWDLDKWRTAQRIAALSTLVSLQGGDHASLSLAQEGRIQEGPWRANPTSIDEELDRLGRVVLYGFQTG